MSNNEKKRLLRALYLQQYDLVQEVIEELSEDLRHSNLEISEDERTELEQIINAHFEQYDNVFKALA